jgi:hypothetical protein
MPVGNADCTEGLSEAVYEYWTSDDRSGFVTPLNAAGEASVKALCWAIARALVDYIESTYPT